MLLRYARTIGSLILGIASLAALILIGSLLVSSVGGSPLTGYEGARAASVVVLLMTLTAIVLAWARFILRSRRPVR